MRFALAVIAAALTGCSQPAPSEQAQANVTLPAETPIRSLVLTPLGVTDADGLRGELGCSFAEKAGAAPLLIGKTDVGRDASASAVIRVGSAPARLSAAGGFGAMERGLAFSGEGLTATVSRGARIATGNESSAHAAVLHIARESGAERQINGVWTCGP